MIDSIAFAYSICFSLSLSRPYQFQGDTVDAGLVSNLHDIENGVSIVDPSNKSQTSTNTIDQQPSITKQTDQANATSQNPCEQKFSEPNCNLNYANELSDTENTCAKQQQQQQQRSQQQQQHSNGGPAAVIDGVKSAKAATETAPLARHTAVDLTPALLGSGEKAALHATTNSEYDVNGNAHHNNTNDTDHKQLKLSNKIVVLLRRSKPIALVLINSVLAVLIAISVCITMGFDYTIPAIVCGLIAIVASSGLWYWLYIAAVTAPRDIRYVFCFVCSVSVAPVSI